MDYIEMKIHSKTDYIGVIRLTLAVIANRMGYTYKEIEDIKIAISETFTNAMRHAYPENEVEETGGRTVLLFHKSQVETIYPILTGSKTPASKSKNMEINYP